MVIFDQGIGFGDVRNCDDQHIRQHTGQCKNMSQQIMTTFGNSYLNIALWLKARILEQGYLGSNVGFALMSCWSFVISFLLALVFYLKNGFW